jgi:hypothetical protein
MEVVLVLLGVAYVAALPLAWIKATRRARELARANTRLNEELAATRSALASEKMWRLVTDVLDVQVAASPNVEETTAVNRRHLSTEEAVGAAARMKVIRPRFGKPLESTRLGHSISCETGAKSTPQPSAHASAAHRLP